ncbi:hypothetical protein HDC92_002202 [Pedobacter sp. AK017]|uniref:hypothetical protein n=1 Tax=Pedobacter sp. AK017 TaxID=2723073 RepID=UPI00161E2128|nr:hypothetical protein [Pedobacter sp. AK017]MBB5438526.1 hypothetical protein [Pedobacter sp. AK017]
MLRKIAFIYQQHFKFTIALNAFVSISMLVIFWDKGYNHYPLYMLALFMKAVAYGICIAVEKMFLQPRNYHFRNLGFSYRMIFGWLYGVDLLVFLLVLLLTGLCKAFI